METNIYKEAVETFGRDVQIDTCIMEMAELTKQVIREKNGASKIFDVCEKIADVQIIIDQMKEIFGKDQIVMLHGYKEKRLIKTIRLNKNNEVKK